MADTVKPGQVWADNDARAKGRTLRVEEIVNDTDGRPWKALCVVLTNSHRTQEDLDSAGTLWVTDQRGKETTVALRRFKPTSTGYRLVSSPDGETT